MSDDDVVDVVGHTLTISANGATTAGHPTTDIENCGFDDYVASDWSEPQSWYRPSRWAFTRLTSSVTGQHYWNGSKTG